MPLATEIARWDGKSRDDIAAIFKTHGHKPDFVTALLNLLPREDCAVGASWLIKHGLEHGLDLSAAQTRQLLKLLPSMSHWESRLHILQSLGELTIPRSCWPQLEAFLRESLSDSNKFVRAWTYNGLNELANANKTLRDEVDEILDMGARDEPASVRARIRNIRSAKK